MLSPQLPLGANLANHDSYQYIAFFSYKRDPLSDSWHEKVMARVIYWLDQELGRNKPRVFFDRHSIENGNDFDEYIRTALKSSAVIISIMSPLYFTSKWCFSEFQSFLDRESKLNLKKGSLIACARFHDGENYPSVARNMQADDFTEFAILVSSFWDSPKAVNFDPLIKRFSSKVAMKVKLVPPFSHDFPVDVVEDDSVPAAKPILRPSRYLSKARKR